MLGSPCSAQRAPTTTKEPLASVRFGGAGDSTPNTAAARSLNGVVRDTHEKAVGGALVYLKDLKTSKIMSVTTDEKGVYRFVGLEQNVDYEFWAQTEEHKSEIKTVSSFDSTVQMVRSLQLK